MIAVEQDHLPQQLDFVVRIQADAAWRGIQLDPAPLEARGAGGVVKELAARAQLDALARVDLERVTRRHDLVHAFELQHGGNHLDDGAARVAADLDLEVPVVTATHVEEGPVLADRLDLQRASGAKGNRREGCRSAGRRRGRCGRRRRRPGSLGGVDRVDVSQIRLTLGRNAITAAAVRCREGPADHLGAVCAMHRRSYRIAWHPPAGSPRAGPSPRRAYHPPNRAGHPGRMSLRLLDERGLRRCQAAAPALDVIRALADNAKQPAALTSLQHDRSRKPWATRGRIRLGRRHRGGGRQRVHRLWLTR